MRAAKEKPGELTAKKLQEMADVVGENHGDGVWKSRDTPAAARSYYLRVVKPELGTSAVRNGREIKTLCYALDKMALGNYAQASDILTQRLKSIHMALQDGHWQRADQVELVPSSQIAMSSLLEEDMANQECRCHLRS